MKTTNTPIRISAMHAAKAFSDLLNRVQYRRERFLVERGGEPICEMSPVYPSQCTGEELLLVLRTLPKIEEEYLDEVERHVNEQPVHEDAKAKLAALHPQATIGDVESPLDVTWSADSAP